MTKEAEYQEHGERLRQFIDAQFNGSQKSMADALGVAESNFSKYVNGYKKYSTKSSLTRLQSVGLNPTWYATGQGEMKYRKTQQQGDIKLNLPIYETPAHALNGVLISGLDDLSPVMKEVTISQRYLDADKLFGFRVSGESMLGEGILPGDLLLCSSQMIPKDGSTVVANINGCIMVKLMHKGRLYSVPRVGALEEIKEYEDDNGAILGVVFKIEREV